MDATHRNIGLPCKETQGCRTKAGSHGQKEHNTHRDGITPAGLARTDTGSCRAATFGAYSEERAQFGVMAKQRSKKRMRLQNTVFGVFTPSQTRRAESGLL